MIYLHGKKKILEGAKNVGQIAEMKIGGREKLSNQISETGENLLLTLQLFK
jgi:hypothetical protein